ncbi:MAG: hypothetical protein ACRD2Y_14115 [Terriglobales bacterium]
MPRRMKTYTGETGYVYQYYFVGRREALASDPEAPATEYVFDATSDRKITFAVSVFLKPEALTAWARAHRRELTGSEQYAAAKMCLLRGFDGIENMREQGRRLVVDAANIEDLLAPLSLD